MLLIVKGVVSENFRTSTIVLAVLSALLLLCLFGTCIHTCRNPSKRQQPAAASGARSAPGYNSGYRSHTGDAETTALNSSGNHLNGALKGGGTNSALMPAAAPRAVSYIPSSLNRPSNLFPCKRCMHIRERNLRTHSTPLPAATPCASGRDDIAERHPEH